MTEQQEQAAKLLAQMAPRDAVALLSRCHNQHLAETEAGKTHPMSAFSLPPAEWESLRAHLLDGGGVIDDGELSVTIMEAIMRDDQATFWPNLIHYLKARLKIRGSMSGVPGGGVVMRGASAIDPIVPEFRK